MKYGNILTGGIGCGKSTVSNLLALEGFHILSADKIAHKILDKNATLISQYFGNEILCDSGIDRKKLGNIVFNDKEKKELLESILHPLIQKNISNECKILESKKKPYFIEIPLYFESSFKYEAEYIICIYATKDMQIDRVIKRDNLTKQEAIKRIESQIDIEIKRSKSDFVIENTSDLKALQNNVNMFLNRFYEIYNA